MACRTRWTSSQAPADTKATAEKSKPRRSSPKPIQGSDSRSERASGRFFQGSDFSESACHPVIFKFRLLHLPFSARWVKLEAGGSLEKHPPHDVAFFPALSPQH